jgi:hypothetical protein
VQITNRRGQHDDVARRLEIPQNQLAHGSGDHQRFVRAVAVLEYGDSPYTLRARTRYV